MSDDGTNPRQWLTIRVWFAAIVTIFCLVLIGWIVLFGTATNALHAGALSSAFLLIAGVLAGFGIGAVAPDFSGFWKK